MKIGQSLFSARKKSGLSQEQVAEKLNISRQTISKWESDETLPNICQFCNCQLEIAVFQRSKM